MVQIVIIDIDEQCYNHIEVVCTLHCQILYHAFINFPNAVSKMLASCLW